MNPPNDRQRGTTTELAKERNREAAERTLTSWIQNSLALIGFGIAFDRIFGAVNQFFPRLNPGVDRFWTEAIGLGAIGIGLFLLILAILGYKQQIKSLENQNYLNRPIRHSVLFLVIVGSITLLGLSAIVAILIRSV